MIITNRHPASVFRYFEEISAIPRGSYNEKGIADYLEAFAKSHGLEVHRDAKNNILIKMPATKGRENQPPILFQGHTDMVCEKNNDVRHDFLHDPIELYVDGDLLRAKGTTLGGDDGIAVAMMLALLDGEIPSHPAYECLFTTAEEVGLDGAHAFDYSLLNARKMINLDSEAFGIVTCGCAGGMRSDLAIDCEKEPFRGNCVEIKVTGLAGGHSGENINSGRANANKVMGVLLANLLASDGQMRLVSLSGGSKDNAIPREAVALVSVCDAEKAIGLFSELGCEIAKNLVPEDRSFRLSLAECEPPAEMYSERATRSAVTVSECVQNGVKRMDCHIAGLVETSRNFGVIKEEDGKLIFVFSSRSSVESQLDDSALELDLLAKSVGATVRHYSRYPGWAYAEKSAVRDAYLSAFKAVAGKDAIVNVIHAGLECGIIGGHVPDMDMISIGPDMFDIHSPAEALSLPSVEAFWQVLERVVEEWG